MTKSQTQYPTKPVFDPIHEEWSYRTGPNTWIVWKADLLGNRSAK